MAAEVVVVGDAVLDVIVTPARPIRHGADVPATIRLGPGGQGANLAIRLARRGVDVRLHCALGADRAGEMLRTALAADGVSVNARETDATGSVVVLIDAGGRRTMLSHRVPLLGAPIVGADTPWLVISGYTLLEPNAERFLGDAVPSRRAVIGCALDDAQVEPWLSAVRRLAPSLLVLNADEASLLAAGEDEPAAALAPMLGAIVVVTEATGASATLADDVVRVAHDPVAAVDTTGAGDAFAATLIAELLDAPWLPSRDALERALTGAASLATAVTLVPGAQARVPGER